MNTTNKLSSQTLVKADNETLFLIGNGPSLRDIDLTALSAFSTLGMNAAYRYWREINWRPTYYACLDTVVGLSHQDEIATLIQETGDLSIRKFLLRRNLIEALDDVAITNKVINFDALQTNNSLLSLDPITTGSHAALWAGSIGYRQIVMLGIDGRYKEIVDGARKAGGIELEIVESNDNPNYFFEGYQQPGDRYNIPNPRPDLHITAWNNTASAFVDADFQIFNANDQSAVRFFDFVDLEKFLGDGSLLKPATESITQLPTQNTAAANGKKGSQHFDFLSRNTWLVVGLLIATAVASALAVLVFKISVSGAILTASIIWLLLMMLLSLHHSMGQQVNGLHHRISRTEETTNETRRQLAITKNRKL